MAIVVFRRRDGLARECSLRIASGDLRTPVLLPVDGGLVSPRHDARMLSRAPPAEDTAALTDVPSYRFTAHSPAAIARPLALRNADLLAAADGPASLGHLHLTQHNDVLGLQLDALYDSGVPVAWIRNPDQLTGTDLIRALVAVKESLPDVVLITSTKHFELIPFLVMCGVDVFDPVPLSLEPARGRMLHDLAPLAVDEPTNKLRTDSLTSISRTLDLLRAAVRAGTVRETVEGYCARDVEAMRTLRLWDLADTSRFADRAKTTPQRFVLAASLGRPEVVRWEREIRERYTPPSVPVLLLLPCSYTKPYSRSRTHQAVREAIGQPGSVHEVIVTSPLGAVPRELEGLYPAAHYDIPVTGTWSAEEIDRSASLVQDIIDKGAYERVMGYLPGSYGLVAAELAARGVDVDVATELPALARLLPEDAHDERRAWGKEMSRAVLDIQYGPGTWSGLEPFHYRKGTLRQQDTRERLAVLDSDTGLYALTIAGARAMGDSLEHRVDIAPFEFKASIFAPGVMTAADGIQRGDDVIVFREGQLAAVGSAEMTGPEMVRSRRGLAITVRERADEGGE